jgi:formamidopyrimidine-DNA glycosylase
VPELPEVETIRRNINGALTGHNLVNVDVRLPKLLRDSPIPDLSVLQGGQLLRADRRAKVLTVAFSNDLSLMVHFKLAGQFAILRPDGSRLVAGHPVPDPSGAYPHKTSHVVFTFDDGSVAYYSDVRQFGWLRLMPTADVQQALDVFRFGPEGVGESLDGKRLSAIIKARSIPIKTLLLDQKVLAGLGNIYVDEALHAAKVHPARPAKTLTGKERRAVIAAIPIALENGIKQGGAKIIHHRAYPVDGFPAVHARAGEACPVCGTTVTKTRVGARGTYLCPTCQRLPRQSGPAPQLTSSGDIGPS